MAQHALKKLNYNFRVKQFPDVKDMDTIKALSLLRLSFETPIKFIFK